MKKLFAISFCLLVILEGKAQKTDPVHFIYIATKTGDNKYDIHVTATIDPNWHIYAGVQPKSAISVPTKITFDKNPFITITGKMKEIGTIEKQRIAEAGIEQNMYEKSVEFVQQISLKNSIKTNVSGAITYQACTGEMCLPPKTVSFQVPVQ
jgi:hypothetical protein